MPQRHQTRQEAVNKTYSFLLRRKLSPAEKEGFVRLDTNPIPALAHELGTSESWARQLVGDLRENGLYEFVQGSNGDSNHWLLKLPEGEASSKQLKLPDAQPSNPSDKAQPAPEWLQALDVLAANRDQIYKLVHRNQELEALTSGLQRKLDAATSERDTAYRERDEAAEEAGRLSEKLKAAQAVLSKD